MPTIREEWTKLKARLSTIPTTFFFDLVSYVDILNARMNDKTSQLKRSHHDSFPIW